MEAEITFAAVLKLTAKELDNLKTILRKVSDGEESASWYADEARCLLNDIKEAEER